MTTTGNSDIILNCNPTKERNVMFKKILILILALMMLLCACEKKQQLGGYKAENGYWYIDFENPTIDAEKKEIKATLSDGRKDTSYIRRPILNVDTEGANAVTESIKTYLDEKYGKYFKDPDDRIIKVDYETQDIYDILTVIVTEKVITAEKTTEYTTCFHYDALADVELNMMEYSNTNGAQLSTVYKAVLESDWAKEYEKTAGTPPYEDVISGIVHRGELMFDIYCIEPDGENVTKLELQVEDVPLQIPEMEQ